MYKHFAIVSDRTNNGMPNLISLSYRTSRVQEEPWNMGAWYFMRARLPEILGDEQPLRCIARPESASPATGSGASHKLEQELLVDEVFH